MVDDKAKEKKTETAPEREERILLFWEDREIFKKSLEKESPKGDYVFYEGPPTANGKPGIHHLEARAFKDVIPRYKTMRGYHVRRKGGWDTHGLPVELQVEKKLGLNSKKAIEEYGIAKFNKQCKESVWEYLEDWKRFTKRIGFWVDLDHPYVTYHNSYIEALWQVLKTVHKKDLLYKDYKVVPWCPRCGTALSSHELGQIDAYKDVKDLSVYVKFKIKEGQAVGSGQWAVGKNTHILAWTTTPWTLPGNVALAVGEEIEYIKAGIRYQTSDISEYYIIAKERVAAVLKDTEYEVVAEMKGKDLLGLEYEPLYPFTAEQVAGEQKEALRKAYRVYGADFVTTTDGTGVVHTAVMYGADDFELGTKIGLPKHHLVDPQGNFVADTGFLQGRFVKDESVAVDIVKDLAHRGLLFKKEKYEHSYPHCWRCQTPLLYYARDSWYIRMSSLRSELVKENESINWEPSYIRDGRFGEWLREIKDWAISRERYWGTPLPVWTTASGKMEVIGSMEELRERTKKSGNRYFVMRHGEATSNEQKRMTSDPTALAHLTEDGHRQVRAAAHQLRDKDIGLIVHSGYHRTRETAEEVAREIGLAPDRVVAEERFHEALFGVMEGATVEEYHTFFTSDRDRFTMAPEGGETYAEMRARMVAGLEKLENQYKDTGILIVGHGGPLWALGRGYRGESVEQMSEGQFRDDFLENAEWRALDFVPYPHDADYFLDLHRPYIDGLDIVSLSGEPMTRTHEVMDVWFDSGAMPFAQDADSRGQVRGQDADKTRMESDAVGGETFDKLWARTPYPADFIAEAIDQTRGWFYTLHAVGVLMGRGKAFRNVICLGLVNDAQGKKMSKSIGNVVDPWEMIEKYGVDTLRLWMCAVNQPGDAKSFDEKTVAEMRNKFFNLLYNVLAFYELYGAQGKAQSTNDTKLQKTDVAFTTNYKLQATSSLNILDQWIVARLEELTALTTEKLDAYKLLEPVRAMRDFIDDLSTWYLRRSRERLKEGDEEAVATLRYVLLTLAKLMAPFAPFAAEDIWLRLRTGEEDESVHLASWPEPEKHEARDSKHETNSKHEIRSTKKEDLLGAMQKTREIVSLALEQRARAAIKVRQPLASLRLQTTNYKLTTEFLELVKDEVNVREVIYDENLATPVELDTTLTPELKQEGELRDLMRAVQDLRKEKGLQAQEQIVLTLPVAHKELAQKYETELKKGVKAARVTFAEQAEPSLELIHEK